MTTTRAKQPAKPKATASPVAKPKPKPKTPAASRPAADDDQDQGQTSDADADADADADPDAMDVDDQQDDQGDEQEQEPTSRRSSTRLRTRVAKPAPVPSPKAKPTPKAKRTGAGAGARTKTAAAAAAASDSDQDENADADDLSDQDDDHANHQPSDDEHDDDFENQPKRRMSRRSAAATPKKAPAASTPSATFKKPTLPASRAKKATAATTTPRGRKRGTVVRLNLDTTGLWDAVTTPNVAMSGIVKQWLTEYHVRPSDALLAVVNMIIAATGCTEFITPARFEDQDAVPDYVEELQSHMTSGPTAASATAYPLISRTKTHKTHMAGFFSFFTHLISSDDDALWDDVLLQVIQQWVAAFVSSPLRAFRHTATSLGLHLATSLCTPLANDNHAYHDEVVDTHTALYDTIFVHRYRDVDAAIRKECMRALATWVERVPDRFLDPTYLRYFGWLLNDQDAGVRTVVLECLAHLYSTPALVPGLRLFTERFKARIIQIAAADVDPGVQRAGVELVCLVYQMGVLGADEVDQVCALVFSKHVQAGGVPEALVGVWKEETESMDWPRLVEWVAQLIAGVYPEAKMEVAVDAKHHGGSGSDTDDGDDDMGMPIQRKSGPSSLTTVDPLKCDHALTLLATSLPTLPLFTSPDPALAHLRRTDTSLAHEHVLIALVCALASAARDSTGRTLAAHLPALLAKYKADDVAQVYLFRAARAGVPVDAWTAAAGTAVLDAVLSAGVAAMKRDAAPVVLDEVARLVGGLSRRQETSVHVAPVVRRVVSEGCASERPATVVAVVKAIKVPEDVLGGEVKDMVEDMEVGSVERLVARLLWLVQMAGAESNVACRDLGRPARIDPRPHHRMCRPAGRPRILPSPHPCCCGQRAHGIRVHLFGHRP
ncbi:hypothetical protein BCR44DRAFT_171775 [Catenaria anguillulae PL171]|uniref:SCD domain-containing protein n=1 Tax=Catenaria anguillulae PL171 TaxID=765915 RepID=A0A1Y2HRY8_9FUNG|nr:hypothetical protein BCR44DRAFT_171775 [Catenaria anguillulae PL171]